MNEKELRHHIEAADRPTDTGRRNVAARVTASCWPGGSADRYDRVALHWLRRWRPARAAAPLPTCSCRAGRCAVCN